MEWGGVNRNSTALKGDLNKFKSFHIRSTKERKILKDWWLVGDTLSKVIRIMMTGSS